MLSFAYLGVFLLLPLPWLLRLVLPPSSRGAHVRVPFGPRLEAASRGGVIHEMRRPLRWVVPGIVWTLVVLALARPQWVEPPVERRQPTRDLLLLIDLSSSMQEEDFTDDTGSRVDRLSAVQQVVGDFLVRRDGDRVGLVVFGDAPFLQAPFSTDLTLVRELLDETDVGMAGPRTALGDAIGLGVARFEDSDAPAKTMIVLTDGNDTRSQVPPVEASRVARDHDIRIYTVAMGDPTTVGENELDEQTLQEVASTTGGQYFFAGDRDRLQGIYAELDRIETREIDVVSYRPRIDLFYLPLLGALLLSVAHRGLETLRRAHATREKVDVQASVVVNPMTGRLEARHANHV